MFKRLYQLPIESQDSYFIFGPRGTGKTAWLKNNLDGNSTIFIDLLEPATFRQLLAKPETLGEIVPPNFQGRVVIDEVQKVPAVLDEVHRLIEAKKIRFILTGSSARKLKQKGVNLLAGRAIRTTMHPLLIQELKDAFSLKHALEFGMLPATYSYNDPAGYIATYVETYLKEEVMQEGLTRNIAAFSRFLEIASFSQGSTINATEIAREAGIDRQVIQNYFSILEDLLIAHKLPAFTKRAKRRLITSERFYYFDAGVYQQLRPKGLFDTPSEIAGAGLETLFYQSLLALIAYKQLNQTPYYWRTANGIEIDFVLYGEDRLLAFEIKHANTITPKMLIGLKQFKNDYPQAQCRILYLGKEKRYLTDDIEAVPFIEGLKLLPDWLTAPVSNTQE